ncbi:MAG: alpha-glucan family phosphorylase [Flavobacteriaceae bacterium]|jgi:phosphorylase/glycogen(starch) synthase|nr:alpha-glucan family phosphorylase [Flavobacteriaceae bacterium]
MSKENPIKPDYLFEISWEVCNKVGGIHTVIATKIPALSTALNNTHILIGPDIIKESGVESEFIEDHILMKAWRAKTNGEGFRIRIGKWKVNPNPVIILIDYTPFFSQKDEIFKILWEQYKLDSISGEWDYVEPALFSYAAGKIIESYIKFHCSPTDKIIAQFHEWMTGTGLLYLRSALPQVGCVFTTHATVLGRSIAGNNLPLYDNLTEYNPDTIAHNFNITSKQSLEKLSAQEADSFTTVSEITSKECEQFLRKPVDTITPNGFQDFISDDSLFSEKQKDGRKKLLNVAEAILGFPIDNNALLIGTSGRYEFKNKGIDVFIKALGKLNKNEAVTREIVAFILVPAGHHGPINELVENLSSGKKNHKALSTNYLTHSLNDPEYDPVLRAIHENELLNTKNNRIKIFFIPSYLNGNDGIFNIPYYDILAGLDLSVFPSYYEPWGYTPLESLAFKVPTITTTLAGFGLWVRTHYEEERPGIAVIERTDTNDEEVIDKIANHIIRHTLYNKKEYEQTKENAFEVSKIALWDNLISYYLETYDNALQKVTERYHITDFQYQPPERDKHPRFNQNSAPNWFNIMVHRNVPEKLKPLEELSQNLWWSWNQEAVNLFKSIDSKIWREVDHNPIALLDKINYTRYQKLEKDETFISKLHEVYSTFKEYMKAKDQTKSPHIAYFCMEYGIHNSLKIYSGGLGILAGDYLKEASDKGTKITGIGLLYRYGYFTQRLSASGEQENVYEPQPFDEIPVIPLRDKDGKWITIQLAFPGRCVHAKVWRVDVGRIELYLLDTDVEDNQPEDRTITYHLYGGDWENRLKQELLLGVGGIRVLQKLNIIADVYHCNEGHAAFIGLERIHQIMISFNLSFDEAKEVVRSSSLFTTHTPVPAGHDAFDEGLIRKYISHYPERFNVSWEDIIALGRIHPENSSEKFSMSTLAVNLSQEVNGVSWLHGKVSQDMFKDMFIGYLPQESHISYVTNGVHLPTWAAPEWKNLYTREFCEGFASHHYDKSCFENIYAVNNTEIWEIRNKLRTKLIKFIKKRLISNKDILYYTPREIIEILEQFNPNKLTFGFARRFATYKRAHLLFKNLETLDQIINHPEHPVQFIFAGKAHPADKAGQDLIKKIVEISKYPQFLGKILFIENYDIELASKMVQGVDIWLNTPTRPMEASGTSGEKAAMNGVMHFSVLDGWWVEGFQPEAGWALPLEQSYENNDFQNELDSEILYSVIENEIAPLYYAKDENDIPNEWIIYIKNSIAKIASNFTTNRMLTDYEERFYSKLNERHKLIEENNFQIAKELVSWKHKMLHEWNSVEIISVKMPNVYKEPITLGHECLLEISVSLGSLTSNDIGVELVIAEKNPKDEIEVLTTSQFECILSENSVAVYQLKYTVEAAGNYILGIRIYANNKLLPHRQDFCLVKWM